jgi:hypothetical protein
VARKAIWTDKREKLLLLALDPGATEGEAQAAGLLLLQSWREAGIRGYDVLDGNGNAARLAIENLNDEIIALQRQIDQVRAFLKDSHARTARLEAENQTLRQRVDAADALERPDWGRCVMPFGKYKGRSFREIPPDYLAWAKRWIAEDDDRYERFGTLVESLAHFLCQEIDE